MSSAPFNSTKSQFLKVHLLQMTSVDDFETNLQFVRKSLEQIPTHQAGGGEAEVQLVCLPENSLYMRVKEGTQVVSFDLSEAFWKELALIAKEKNAVLHFGSVALRRTQISAVIAAEEKAVQTNSSVILYPDGKIQADYAKIHLFDIELEGHKPIRESDAFLHGNAEKFMEVGDWLFGQSICYDLRFAELYQRYAAAEVDGILVPAAFLVPTGKAHWEILLRARAIESQAYVLAAAQVGEHHGKDGGVRSTYGHSLVVDPWGEVKLDAGTNQAGLFSFVLERKRLEQVRKQIPMRSHRRLF